jgi:hypothetical protein
LLNGYIIYLFSEKKLRTVVAPEHLNALRTLLLDSVAPWLLRMTTSTALV